MSQAESYRICFKPQVPPEAVEDTLVVSAIAAESLLGRAAFKLDAMYQFDRESGVCVINASTAAGQHIARVFVGLMAKAFGEGAFTVERDEPVACAAGGQQS